MKSLSLSFAVLNAALIMPTAVHAGLFAFDSFEYAPGEAIHGQGGGSGFADSWIRSLNSGPASNGILSQSLSFGALDTSGARGSVGPRLELGNTSFISRTLSSPIGVDNTTVYFSVLLQPEGTLGVGMFDGFFGIQFDAPGFADLAAGYPGGSLPWGIDQIGGTGRVSSDVQPVVGTPALLVLKMEFGAGFQADRITLFLNPKSPTEPATGLVKQDMNTGLISRLALQSGGAFSVDEIRLGTDYADVVPGFAPVPEPEEWAALSGVALVAFAFARRRRLSR